MRRSAGVRSRRGIIHPRHNVRVTGNRRVHARPQRCQIQHPRRRQFHPAHAGRYRPHAEKFHGRIVGPANHRRARRQPAPRRRTRQHATHHRRRLHNRRQPRHIPANQPTQLRRPAARNIIRHQRAHSIGKIRFPRPRQAKPQKILRQIQPPRPRHHRRLVLLQPGQHRQRPGRVHPVQPDFHNPLTRALL